MGVAHSHLECKSTLPVAETTIPVCTRLPSDALSDCIGAV